MTGSGAHGPTPRRLGTRANVDGRPGRSYARTVTVLQGSRALSEHTNRLGRPRIRDRLRVWLRPMPLDRALAAGVAPDTSPALAALRARALTQLTTRRNLSDRLRQIVRMAHRPAHHRARIGLRPSE